MFFVRDRWSPRVPAVSHFSESRDVRRKALPPPPALRGDDHLRDGVWAQTEPIGDLVQRLPPHDVEREGEVLLCFRPRFRRLLRTMDDPGRHGGLLASPPARPRPCGGDGGGASRVLVATAGHLLLD